MKRIKDQGAKVGERVSRRRGRVRRRRRKSGKEAESQSRYGGGQSVALESVGVRTSLPTSFPLRTSVQAALTT